MGNLGQLGPGWTPKALIRWRGCLTRAAAAGSGGRIWSGRFWQDQACDQMDGDLIRGDA